MQHTSSEARKVRNEISKNGKPDTQFADTYSDLEDIQKDWKALKSDVAKLSHHATTDSRKRLANLSQKAFERLEAQITEKPVQTLAIAFFTGAIASVLLRRRR